MASDRSTSQANSDWLERFEVGGGMLFLLASAVGIAYGAYTVIRQGTVKGPDPMTWSFLLAAYSNFIVIFVFAAFAALVGLALLKRAGRSTNYVVRPEDRDSLWPLITEPKPEAIDQYVRLASLSGLSGGFTKVGFTGLPLATVALTLIFVLLSLAFKNEDLMELAKLTLGAFIGSFVQRQVERGERDPGGEGATAPRPMTPKLPV